MTYKLLSTSEAAAELGVSQVRVQQIARQGRIQGAFRVGAVWVIPSPVKIVPGKRGPVGVAGDRCG